MHACALWTAEAVRGYCLALPVGSAQLSGLAKLMLVPTRDELACGAQGTHMVSWC
jgi:hypothetical protein